MYEWIILNCHNWLIKKIWFVYESDITASQINKLTLLMNLWMLQAEIGWISVNNYLNVSLFSQKTRSMAFTSL